MKRILSLLTLLVYVISPCLAFTVNRGVHGFLDPSFKVSRPSCIAQTDTNSGNNSAQFTAANSETLSRASEAALQTGDIDFSWVGWVYLDSEAASLTVYNKTLAGVGEFQLRYDQPSDRFFFYVADLSTFDSVTANTFGAVTTGTWYFISTYHNAAANEIGISVNNGAYDTTATAISPTTNTTALSFGSFGVINYFDGRMQSFGFAKSILSAANITSFYNAGAGKKWCQLTSTEQALFTGWWELGEASGNRADSTANALTLTDNNTVTQGAGVTTGVCICP